MHEGKQATLETARNGSPTITVAGRYVHSSHNPEREAERITRALARRDPPAVVLLGMGLGYQAAALLATTSSLIIAYEPSEELRRLAMSTGPLAGDDHSDRLFIAPALSELSSLLPRRAAQGFETLELPALGAYDEDADAARSIVRAFAGRLEINRNTLNRFGRLWVRNLCRNLDELAGARGVAELASLMEGIPTLLLAAGPTLDQVLPHLRELARRCLVIAVDTAVSPARRAGIEPDFAVVVDPQYWNARHLDRIPPGRTLLVSEASAHPFVFRHFRPPLFLCSSLFPLGRSFEALLGAFGSLGAGGSVSTSAWDLARLLGTSQVYAAGLDLGFPGGRTHCRASFFEELALALGSRLQPAEGVIFRYTWSAGPQHVPGTDGEALLSDRRMEIYRNWFASQLALPRATPTASLTRGGARIEGMRLADLEEVLALPDRRDEIASRLGRVARPLGNTTWSKRRRALASHATELGNRLAELAELARAASSTVEEIRRRHETGAGVDFSPLAPLDERIRTHPAGELGSFLIQEAISEISAGYGSASVTEQIDASSRIYAGLADAARFHAERLVESVAQLRDRRGKAVQVYGGRHR